MHSDELQTFENKPENELLRIAPNQKDVQVQVDVNLHLPVNVTISVA